MIWEQRMMRLRLFTRAMSITRGQYSAARELISSLVQMNSTRSMSIPMAFQTSIMYSPTFRIFFRSPPILLFR